MVTDRSHETGGRGYEVVLNRARTITPEEYLTFERDAETKHEYDGGQVFAMTGASRRHNRIVVNLITTLATRLRGGPCQVYPSDMRLHVAATGLYTYPDISIACGEQGPEDPDDDTLRDPTVLIEVLSPSTERYDRGRKAEHYRTIESLREYLLVSQHQPRIEQYARTTGGQWLLTEAIGLDARIRLGAIDCELPLAEVYENDF